MNRSQRNLTLVGMFGLAALLHLTLCGWGSAWKPGNQIVGGGYDFSRLARQHRLAMNEFFGESEVSEELDEELVAALWFDDFKASGMPFEAWPADTRPGRKLALYARFGNVLGTVALGIVLPLALLLATSLLWLGGWGRMTARNEATGMAGAAGHDDAAQALDELAGIDPNKREFEKWRAQQRVQEDDPW